MRRVLLGAALGALLTILISAPAGAVPPNEILIAKNLQRLGVVPGYATAGMARAAARALAAKGTEHPVKAPAGTEATGEALGRYVTARVVARGATSSPYATDALVLLVEFGGGAWPGGDATGHDLSGPDHGQIPQPAADDNATFWPGDFSPAHYQQMLFGASYPIVDASGGTRGTSADTLRSYYLEQSHGAYTVDGGVQDWVKLDLPESWYGADSLPWETTDDLTGPVWRVARDAIVKFAAEHPGFDWARYDQENPWGITGAGFHQPDGYLDHLILIHAGSDESGGGGAQGADAIWAHSWGIYESPGGGPGGGPGLMIPGTEGQGPQGLGIWAFNYTIDPEDGEVGVFAHEFGHDLGLSDEYDTSSTTGDASSGFWTIMASGSWLGRQWGLGSRPAPMNADDRAYLGFIQPRVVRRGRTATVRLQAAATGASAATAVKIPLPRARHVTELSRRDGALEWYSTAGNDLDVSLATKDAVAVPAGGALTFRTWYDIDDGYDFAFVKVSGDGGTTWDTVAQYTGTDTQHWARTVTVDLSAYQGRSVLVRFEYVTDESVVGRGWEISDVRVGGAAVPVSGFAAGGWIRVDGRHVRTTARYYIAEYRTRSGFDASLADCYQWNDDFASWVDWFSYDEGLHLIYRDSFYTDNDVAAHIGHGGWMVVDARPRPDGVSYGGTAGYWRPRIQVRDAAFGLRRSARQRIYFTDYESDTNVGERIARGKLAQPWFDDTHTYWFADDPEAGVMIPRRLGVRIHVRAASSRVMTLWVDNRK